MSGKTAEPKPARVFRGTVAVSAEGDGYGFIKPDDWGGQLLVRRRSIDFGLGLRVGDAVRYELAGGSSGSRPSQ